MQEFQRRNASNLWNVVSDSECELFQREGAQTTDFTSTLFNKLKVSLRQTPQLKPEQRSTLRKLWNICTGLPGQTPVSSPAGGQVE